MRKLINIQNDHTHVRIITYIKGDRSENGYVPGQQMAMRYHKMGLVHSNEHEICHSYHQTKIKKHQHHA